MGAASNRSQREGTPPGAQDHGRIQSREGTARDAGEGDANRGEAPVTKSYRQLRPDEPIPSGTPTRHVAKNGYVTLTWSVGGSSYVRISEHRLVAGRPPSSLHVHHINGDKHDNRLENLRIVTPLEHKAEHRTWSLEEAKRLYESGLSYDKVAEALGTKGVGSVWLALQRAGVAARPRAFSSLLTHCRQGHELSADNTRIVPGKYPRRQCVTCKREQLRAWRARSKAS